jgi:hypothetical protein
MIDDHLNNVGVARVMAVSMHENPPCTIQIGAISLSVRGGRERSMRLGSSIADWGFGPYREAWFVHLGMTDCFSHTHTAGLQIKRDVPRTRMTQMRSTKSRTTRPFRMISRAAA